MSYFASLLITIGALFAIALIIGFLIWTCEYAPEFVFWIVFGLTIAGLIVCISLIVWKTANTGL